MEVTMKMHGARELEEFMLKHLPATVARRQLLAGMRKAAKPTENFAKVFAAKSKKSGALVQSIGTVTLRKNADIEDVTNAVAAIRLGPLSGAGAKSMSAWAIYQSYYRKGKVTLKRGAPVGQIRHGHLVEFGFTHRSGTQVRPQPFLGPAARIGIPMFTRHLVVETRKKVEAAIRKHNARSPVKRR